MLNVYVIAKGTGLGTPMTGIVMKLHTVSVLCHYNKHLLLLLYVDVHNITTAV